ncbi:rCG61154 [Rattus norvegicus]|uniref:RCG61154 n=1 Tax=Rattus norvegicus TaxID=10116 RepID=A6KE15_RAT|nr:rCG61154 [Rattus norvegicus]
MTAWGLRCSQSNQDPFLLKAKHSALHKALDFR